nr:2-isopropylmalate synthase [Oculatella sp. LEGE 06141]
MKHPAQKYRAFAPVQLFDRTWPNQIIKQPPIWLSTDLRDGNQALIEPMNSQRKLQMFKRLVEIGFKEIEVAFPSASQTDFDFVRYLIEQDLIPDDVTIQVLTPAREPLIRRTFAALHGVKRAIVHLYNATSPVFRRTVFGLTQAETICLATSNARLFNELAANQPDADWRFQYSPETFTATELEFAKDICDAVLDVWQPTPERKAIINLPATVEVATPNVFADQVEWMHRQLARRDSIILSVHPHNDRGCAIAAAELAQMAGADRVEGCLFGNGERTGNVDLVTLALNLYTQGIDPGLDFSNINDIARVIEACTQLPIHPRHPYVGDLVFTAFSGSHQDAIKKGFAAQQPDAIWDVPYLPIDPADVGRTYESVVRVNSQSGKGGIAFLLERDYGLVLPRRLQIEFSQVVQHAMDRQGQEMSSADLWQLFEQEYLQACAPCQYLAHHVITERQDRQKQCIVAMMQMHETTVTVRGEGRTAIAALLNGLGCEWQVVHHEERSRDSTHGNEAIVFVELTESRLEGSTHGVGIHADLTTASLLAVLSAVNQGLSRVDASTQSSMVQTIEAQTTVPLLGVS